MQLCREGGRVRGRKHILRKRVVGGHTMGGGGGGGGGGRTHMILEGSASSTS